MSKAAHAKEKNDRISHKAGPSDTYCTRDNMTIPIPSMNHNQNWSPLCVEVQVKKSVTVENNPRTKTLLSPMHQPANLISNVFTRNE